MPNSSGNISDCDEEWECSGSGPDSPREKTELELLREKNIKEGAAYMEALLSKPEYADIVQDMKTLKKTDTNKSVMKKNPDPSFRSRITIPLVRRKSARLENKSPIFTKDDLIDESTFRNKRRYEDDDDYADLEKVVHQPKKRMSRKKTEPYTPLIPVEDVTELMIKNIAKKVSTKVYYDNGTSCHQCRQKTKDQKTCCRSKTCVGARGQFCGVCLENRTQIGIALCVAGICNCSFCRTKAGKRPTGILAPHAFQAGHKSVKDFLDSLKGEGDFPHQDDLWKTLKDPKNMLGFLQDLTGIQMGGGVQHKFILQFLTCEKMEMYIEREENHLRLLNQLYGETVRSKDLNNSMEVLKVVNEQVLADLGEGNEEELKIIFKLEDEGNKIEPQSKASDEDAKNESDDMTNTDHFTFGEPLSLDILLYFIAKKEEEIILLEKKIRK
ncbi:hypothetical protein NQ317_000933 [Molorchus minor]|uniref:Zinc-finger domain-containing protein n=1 Tax=Molorchus minor TaxID=1323400 RepID=A0ABQ9K1K8_9CUCU|nr:hypothetical protein NQ317_000933 [Molorchus minor]